MTISMGDLGCRADLVSSESQQKNMKRGSQLAGVNVGASNKRAMRRVAKNGTPLLTVCPVVMQGAT